MAYYVEIRRVLFSTNAIESLNLSLFICRCRSGRQGLTCGDAVELVRFHALARIVHGIVG